jgi:HK97 family phage prohead protease
MQRFNCALRELKFATDQATGEFEGYGAVFGNEDSYGDVIVKGAFKGAIRDSKKSDTWPAMLLQHGFTSDFDMPIGVWTEMEEDEFGLKMKGQLAINTQRGRDAYELLKMQPRPAINGLSIGYIPRKFDTGTKPGEPRRTLKEIQLMEVSLVTFPANDLARVENVKSDLTIRIAENALRDVGFTQSQAKSILAQGYSATMQRDVDDVDAITAAIARNVDALKAAHNPHR